MLKEVKKGEDREEASDLFRKSRLSHRFGEQSRRTHSQMLECKQVKKMFRGESIVS